MSENTPDRFMKFAAGELTAVEEADVLLDCEIDPALWRQLAVAMVEHRRIVMDLQAMKSPQPLRSEAAGRKFPGLQMAALLLIGLLIGAASTWVINRDQQPQLAETEVPAKTTPAAEAKSEPVVVLLEPDLTSPRQSALIRQQEYLRQAMQPVITKHDRDALEETGYRIEEEPVLYVLTDEEGNRSYFPQRNVRLTPIDLVAPK